MFTIGWLNGTDRKYPQVSGVPEVVGSFDFVRLPPLSAHDDSSMVMTRLDLRPDSRDLSYFPNSAVQFSTSIMGEGETMGSVSTRKRFPSGLTS
jgi:hypothetical protein